MTTPYYTDDAVTLYHGDCLDVLRALPDASVDAVVTDPPYGLEFMGKEWDRPWAVSPTQGVGFAGREDNLTLPSFGDNRNANCRACGGRQRGAKRCTCAAPQWDRHPADDMRAFQAWCEQWATECLRVLKPGGHLLAFGGTRTSHRLACAIEDAGFEVRDSIAWLYGSGFPKSLDVSKAIDKAAGAEREVVGLSPFANRGRVPSGSQVDVGRSEDSVITAPATPDAERWQGWGTALKPAHEPCLVAQKPYAVWDILAGIGSQLARLEDECSRHANDAGSSSTPTRPGSPEAKDGSAPGHVATQPEGAPVHPTRTGEEEGSSAQTGTSPSESTVETCWSTVTSWSNCWGELCDLTSTSTTSTMTEVTTDLTTLWSCMSSLTVGSTPHSPTPQLSSPSTASAVDSLFAATVLRLRVTRALSAPESATGSTPTSRRDADAPSPAFEPVVVARKPLAGTVASNVLAHGTGALNIDGCRIGDEERWNPSAATNGESAPVLTTGPEASGRPPVGRWPANVILDESQAAELDRQSGVLTSGANPTRRGSDKFRDAYGDFTGQAECEPARGADSGGASRFFYVAKAPTVERPREGGIAHPTVKPLDLMRWLVRLVTPPGGVVLEPFAGSGTTAEACVIEGFKCLAIEREADYLPLIVQRLTKPIQPDLFGGAA